MNIRFFFLLATLLLIPCVSTANELDERQQIRNKAFEDFAYSRFDELERQADKYRDYRERTKSGLWKLTFFYNGISDYASWNNRYGWDDMLRISENWLNERPNSPTAILAHGILLENHGWSFKIAGRDDLTEQEARLEYQKNLRKARRFLQDNKSRGAVDPHWYVSMVRLATALGLSKSEVMSLVDASSSTRPYYYQTYFAAVDYFSPKWGGTVSTLDEYVRAVVDITKNEEGMGMYARIYWAALQSWYAAEVWPALDWSDFRQGVYDVLKKNPDQWNINNFAKLACVGQDKELTAELVNKIETPDLYVWEDDKFYKACLDWSTQFAFNGTEEAVFMADITNQ